MDLTILTGASRGMGAAIARALLKPGHELLCLSRRTDTALTAAAADAGAVVEQWAADLAAPEAVAQRLEAWLAARDPQAADRVTLINNAAALTRIGPLDRVDAAELSAALRVGIDAPVLLTAAFLRATRPWRAAKRVLNISSGLGRRAMAGQASYCAVKGGLDHFTRALALDEAERVDGAKVVSLAPGVIDTEMQVQLRGADGVGFPEKANFVGLKEKGVLMSPEVAASKVLAYLERADFGANPIADVRDA